MGGRRVYTEATAASGEGRVRASPLVLDTLCYSAMDSSGSTLICIAITVGMQSTQNNLDHLLS